MKKFAEFIKNKILEDNILKLLICGVVLPILIFVAALLLAILNFSLFQVLPSLLQNIIYYVFAVSIFALPLYLAFIKSKFNNLKNNLRFLILIWFALVVIICLIWGGVTGFTSSLSNGFSWGVLWFILIPIGLVEILTGIPTLILFYSISNFNSQKSNTIFMTILFSVIFSLITGIFAYILKPADIVLPYPIILSHYGNSYSCEGLVVNSASADNQKFSQRKGVISTSTTKNLDKIAIEIDGDSLKFTTQADVETGSTEGRPMNIIENSDKYLVATDRDTTGIAKSYDVFTMNKKTGMALWTQNMMMGFPSEDPLSITEYLICR